MSTALDSRDPRALALLADPTQPQSTQELADLTANVASLDISDVSLQPLAQAPDRTPGRVAVSVEIRWRSAGSPTARSAQVPMVVTAGQARFVTARIPGESGVPLWLLGRVDVLRAPGIRVESLGSTSATRLLGLSVRAVRDVREYLPPLAEDLVVELPASTGQFSALFSSGADRAPMAAVTLEQFGGSQGAVLVDPGAMEQLSDLAAQIVITHEVVHVALGASRSQVPKWLQEGYADYVAYATHPVPVREAASDLLEQVARSEPPRRLPGARQFEGARAAAAYEASWLASRWIAAHYGPARLLRLYRAAGRGGDARPIRRVLGISRAELTKRWASYVVRLAA
jgi:hypothetical protein